MYFIVSKIFTENEKKIRYFQEGVLTH